MIYIDPPYGIKFGSNWQTRTDKRDVTRRQRPKTSPARLSRSRRSAIPGNLAFTHTSLTCVIGSVATRDLLTESGSVFVQIGDQNIHLVRALLDEVFGSENFVSLITYKKTTGAGSPSGGTDVLASVSDYIVWYARNTSTIKYQQLYAPKGVDVGGAGQYSSIELADGTRRRATITERMNLPDGARLFRISDLTSQTAGETTIFPVRLNGTAYAPAKGGWKTNSEGMESARGRSSSPACRENPDLC